MAEEESAQSTPRSTNGLQKLNPISSDSGLLVIKTPSPEPTEPKTDPTPTAAPAEKPLSPNTDGHRHLEAVDEDKNPEPPKQAPNPKRLTEDKLSKRALERLKEFPTDDDEPEIELKHLSFKEKVLFFINHMWFTLTLTFLVLLSLGILFSVLFGVPETPETQWVDFVIVIIFTIETFVRLIVIGPKSYFTDALCLADFCVSIIDISILILTLSGSNDQEQLRFIRVLRVCRLSKISRIARLQLAVDEEEGADDRGKVIEKDEDGHIYGFNSAKLFSLGFLLNLSGTVVAMPEIWVQSLMLIIVTTLLAALTCPLECDPFLNTYSPDCDTSACVNSIDPAYGLMFLGLAAFLLGIFAQLLFDRWWNIRVLIQMLFAEIKDTAMMTTSFIRSSDKESTQVRDDIIRWAKLGAYLLEKKIDGKENYRSAILTGYMTEDEWDKLEGTDNAHVLPQQWAFDTLCQAREKDIISEYGSTFDNLLTSFPKQRNLCSDILMILETPMPYIFIHLMTVICKVNLLFTAIACGTVIGQAVHAQQFLQIVIGYIIIFLGNMLIEGLLRLHVVLSDPFGDDACDFPWQMMMEEMDREVEMMHNQFGKMHKAGLTMFDNDNVTDLNTEQKE